MKTMRATLTFCILTFFVSQVFSQIKTNYPVFIHMLVMTIKQFKNIWM